MMRRATNDGVEHGYFTHDGNGNSQGRGWHGDGHGGDAQLPEVSVYTSPDGDGWGVDLCASLGGDGYGNGFPIS